jgi:hypothetical protein
MNIKMLLKGSRAVLVSASISQSPFGAILHFLSAVADEHCT